jgi:hypothetical protein
MIAVVETAEFLADVKGVLSKTNTMRSFCTWPSVPMLVI